MEGLHDDAEAVITHGSNPKQVALTFDDGPSEWTLPILETLGKFNAKATFFVLGKYARQHPDIINEIWSRGHEIGNHSENHLCLGDFPKEVVEREIQEPENVIGKVPLFRPPYGRLAQTPVEAIAAMLGYHTVMWTVIPGDWAAKSTEEIVGHVNDRLSNQDKANIVLLHDGGPKGGEDRHFTVEAVERILERFDDREFVTVSGLDG